MRVTQSSISDQFLYRLGLLTNKEGKLMNQLTTGQKVLQSSDDPSAASSVMQMQSQQRTLTQYKDNAAKAGEISTATYNAVDAIKKTLVRAEEIGVSADGLTTSEEFAAYATEMDSMIQQAIETANTKYNGQYLFAGTDSGTQPFGSTKGTDGNIDTVTRSATGGNDGASIEIADGVTVSPYSSATNNTDIKNMIDHMIALRQALTNKDSTAVSTANANLTTDENKIINQISQIGALQSRINWASSQSTSQNTALSSRISDKADVDVATATVEYSRMTVAYEAAIKAGSKIMSISILDYL